METLAAFYGGMIALTALYLFIDVRPRQAGDWFGLGAIALFWPAALACALYAAIKAERA